ncbi:MAG: hypothetical protein LRY56_02825 [Burkholderiaceae bacterium]|nr:hypothetical protein [Burkholderiaceae bacterium]MCD8517221.1 hypothetical protein [Burkholderiaceae bacterium]MCD8536487.1 hypothetical protein [Burkholderiaceae bacterium]
MHATRIVVLGFVGAILLGTIPLMRPQAFEVISAFATVSLSTGITANLPPIAQLTLAVIIVIGCVGKITVAAALATGSLARGDRHPEDRETNYRNR